MKLDVRPSLGLRGTPSPLANQTPRAQQVPAARITVSQASAVRPSPRGTLPAAPVPSHTACVGVNSSSGSIRVKKHSQ